MTLRVLPGGLDAAAVLTRAGVSFPFTVVALRETNSAGRERGPYTWHGNPRCDKVEDDAPLALLSLSADELGALNDAGQHGRSDACPCAVLAPDVNAWLGQRAELAGLHKGAEHAAYWAPASDGQYACEEAVGWLKLAASSYDTFPLDDNPDTADPVVSAAGQEALAKLRALTAAADLLAGVGDTPAGNALVRVQGPIQEIFLAGNVADLYYASPALLRAAGAYTVVGVGDDLGGRAWRMFLHMPAGAGADAVAATRGSSVLGLADPAGDTVATLTVLLGAIDDVALQLRREQHMGWDQSYTIATAVMAERRR